MNRSLPRTCLLLLVAFLLCAPVSSQAGVFKNLFDRAGKTLEDYNRDMWTGENSVGKTALNGKGGFNQRFEAVAAAMTRAQDNAKANLKAVWESLKDIALWLPRKLDAAFRKLMGKITAFANRLNQLNSGGTVKERWANLTGQGPGAPQSMARASLEAPETSEAPQPYAELRDLLAEDPTRTGPRASVEVVSQEILSELASEEMASGPRAPSDSPSAPESGSSDGEVFSQIFRMTDAIENGGNRGEARKRVRLAYVTTLDDALSRGKVAEAADMIRSSADLYQGDPGPMVRAMEVLSRRHPRYGATLKKSARRMENMARRASQSP